MSADKHLQSWQERFEMAEAMQPLLGKLYRNQGVEVVVYGKPYSMLLRLKSLKRTV